MNRKNIIFLLLILLNIFTFTEAIAAWSYFTRPRVIFGGSTGFFRASLDNYTSIYISRWDNYHSGQISFRAYKNNYVTVQYARFQKTARINDNNFLGNAKWNERIINVGVRWYSESSKRWRLFTGLGFTFIHVKEKAGFSLLAPDSPNDVSTNGSGFFLEIGGDYLIIPHVALNLELEVTSASEGGTPGFVGSSLGGYAFLAGLNFHF